MLERQKCEVSSSLLWTWWHSWESLSPFMAKLVIGVQTEGRGVKRGKQNCKNLLPLCVSLWGLMIYWHRFNKQIWACFMEARAGWSLDFSPQTSVYYSWATEKSAVYVQTSAHTFSSLQRECVCAHVHCVLLFSHCMCRYSVMCCSKWRITCFYYQFKEGLKGCSIFAETFITTALTHHTKHGQSLRSEGKWMSE